MISPCIEPGCSKLCMGLFCIDHDSRPAVEHPRGRPWPPVRRGQTISLRLAATGPKPGRAPVKPAA